MKKTKIFVCLLICAMTILFTGCTHNFNLNSYLVAYNNSNTQVTQISQKTTITDSQTLVYEKEQNIYIENNKTKLVVSEKKLNESLTEGEEFSTTTVEEYYSNNTRYFKQDGSWITEQVEDIPTFSKSKIEEKYIESSEYNEEILEENTCTISILDSFVANVVKNAGTELSIVIKIDSNGKIIYSLLSYKNAQNRLCSVETTYSYQKVSVVLPL